MKRSHAQLISVLTLSSCGTAFAGEETERLLAVEEQAEPTRTETNNAASSRDGQKAFRGFIDFNGYYDTRKAATFTVNTLLNFPYGIQYFSLVNYFNTPSSDELQDIEYYVTEQNLRVGPLENVPLDLAGQWLSLSGPDNDLLRFGVRAKVYAFPGIKEFFQHIGLSYFFTAFAVQTNLSQVDGYPFQIEHVYRWNILSNYLDERLYLAGFLDHNLVASAGEDVPASRVLTEHQLGVRVWRGFHTVCELRFNQYLPEQEVGVGLGLEYFVPLDVKY